MTSKNKSAKKKSKKKQSAVPIKAAGRKAKSVTKFPTADEIMQAQGYPAGHKPATAAKPGCTIKNCKICAARKEAIKQVRRQVAAIGGKKTLKLYGRRHFANVADMRKTFSYGVASRPEA